MKKRALILVNVAILIGVLAAVAIASTPVKLLVNGQEIPSNVSPQIVNDRTMVPVRWIAEALGADVRWDQENNTVHIDKPYYISSNSEAETKLYPFQQENGMYKGFILEVKDNRQYFDWKNVVNPTFAPQILFNDINQDGDKELIIILTTGTGTGFHTEDIHVLNPATFAETEIAKPTEIVKQNLDTKIESIGDQMAIHIKTGEETITVYKNKDYAATWSDKIIFENSYHYIVLNNELVLNMGAQVSPAGFIGELEVTYTFENGKHIPKTVKYNKEDNAVTKPALPTEPPEIVILDESDIPITNYRALKSSWNDIMYDRESYYQVVWNSEPTLLTGLHRPKPGEKFILDFGGFAPDQVAVQMAYLTESSEESLLPTVDIPVSGERSIYEFINPPASTGNIPTNGRCYSITAIWGDNSCEYVFAVDGKYDHYLR